VSDRPDPTADPARDRFRLLFVCTGNICRSPVAERLARLWLDEHLGPRADAFEVGSAGTQGLGDLPMEERAATPLQARGGTPHGFLSRALTQDLVARSDLVVGMTRAHRAAAARLEPRAIRRAFTLREVARLAAAVGPAGAPPADPVARARDRVLALMALRGTLPSVAPEDDDVEDPFGCPPEVHERVAARIQGALALLLPRLVE